MKPVDWARLRDQCLVAVAGVILIWAAAQVLVIFYFFVVQMIENHILAPRISGHAVGLHPVAALLALLAGADLFGIWGALFAVPFVGIAAVLATALYKSWRGQPVVVERGRMKLRLPRRGPKKEAAAAE